MGDAKRKKDAQRTGASSTTGSGGAQTTSTFDLNALHHVYREALCFFEAYRRLGFSADDIFAATAGEDGLVQLSIILRTQGAECVAVAGFLPDTLDQVARTWTEITDKIRDTTVALDSKQTQRMWMESMAYQQFWALPETLARKGIRITMPTSTVPAREKSN